MVLSMTQFSPGVDCSFPSCELGACRHCFCELADVCTVGPFAVQFFRRLYVLGFCALEVLPSPWPPCGLSSSSSARLRTGPCLDCSLLEPAAIPSLFLPPARPLVLCQVSCFCPCPLAHLDPPRQLCNCAFSFGCFTTLGRYQADCCSSSRHLLAGAPKTCIGGSGTCALPGCASDRALCLLATLGNLVCPFFCTLLLLSFLALWRLLVLAIPGGSSPLHKLASIPSAALSPRILLAWQGVGTPFAPPEHRHFRVVPRHRHLRKGREVCPAGRRGFCRFLLTCFSLPVQVWAAPKPWSEAVNVLIAAARIMPEPLSAPSPARSDPHDLDLQLRISIADNACSHILNASLDNSEDLPVPPLNDDESVEDAGSFVTGIFYVLAPHYQSEIVQMVLRMPSDLQSILTQARRGLNSLRMRFSFKVVPTFPQLGPDYASVLVVPVWLEATSMQVVVWDFRGLGGPVYAAYCWNGMTYGDCVRESRRHGFHRWLVYVNGHSQALAPDSTFVAVPGGVIQFRPEGQGPIWPGTLPDRIERPNSWNADPDLPEIQVERPLLILHHDQTTLFSSSRHPVPSARVFLTSLVERTPETALIVAPPGNFLTDVDFYGVACRDVLGVYPLTPCPDRESILIFLDPRQTGNPLAHILLPERRVAPVELVRFLSLRPPVCHKIAFWPRPMEDGRLLLSEGDTVVFGYVDETVCSDDSTGELSDSSDDPDADSAHDSPDGHNTPSPSYRPASLSGADHAHVSRSRSPSRPPRGHAAYCAPSTSLLFTASAGLLFCACPTAASPTDVFLREETCLAKAVCFESGAHVHLATALLVALCQGLLVWFRGWVLCLGALECLTRVCRLIAEPVCQNASEQQHLNTLRSLAFSLGGPWLPRLPFFGLDPDHLEALGSPDEEEQVPAQLQMICCAVFKHGYSPECVTVPVPLPATPDELLDALRSARAPAMQELFPVLSPIIPQHGEGNAIFSARPVWGPGFVSVCLDTSAFDGRIFLGYVAPYVTRAELIRKANLPPNVEPDVWVGFDSECLPEETWAHMVSGLLIHFTPPGEKSPELSSLGLLLLQPERWSGTPVSTVPSVEGAYCLVQEDHCRLFLADTRYPALFHQQLSLASGVDQACMRLFAAQPCPSDAMVEGVLCKAVIGVAVQGPHLRARPWHLVLLDCRPIECGWQAWVVFDCQLDLDVLLTAYSADAPLGWCARLALQTQQRGMQTVPGQTLVICFVPADSSWAFGGSVVPDAHVSGSRSDADTASGGRSGPSGAAASSSSPVPHTGTGSDVVAAQAVCVSTGPTETTAMHFLLLTQGYRPELVSVHIDPLQSLEAICRLIDEHREPHGRSRFPRLVPPPFQPAMSFACLLAMPAWEVPSVSILIMCYVRPVRVLSVLAPSNLDIPAVLRLAGVDSSDVHVYLADVPWALLRDATFEVRSGDLVTICPANHPRIPPLSLRRMLSTAEGWHSEPQLPGPFERLAWVLVNQACHRVPLSEFGGPPLREVFAFQIGASPEDHVVLPAVPTISDHAFLGIPSSQVFVASRPSGVEVFYILDLRPILLDLLFAAARGGRVEVAELCRSYRIRCPEGYCIRLYGGSSPPGAANHVRYVHSGQVLTMEFHPIRSSAGLGPLSFRPPSEDEDSDSDDPDRGMPDLHPLDPSPTAPGGTGSCDAGTGSTSAAAATGGFNLSLCLGASRLEFMWNGSCNDHAILDGHCWDTSVPKPSCALRCPSICQGKEASAFVFHGSSTPWVWHAVCAISLYFDALRDGVVMWLTGPFQAALLLGSRWLTSVLSLRAVGCLIQCIAGRLQALASSSVQPSLSQQGRAGRAFAVLVCAYGLTRLAPATHALAAAGFLTAFMPAAVSDLRWSPSTLVVGILLLQLLSPAGAVKLNSPEPPVDCLSGVARALRSAILHSIPRPLVSRDSEPRSGHVEPECQFVHKCLDFPASIGIVLGIEGFRTLLEESAWHSSSQAFYLASTLLDTLEEHFRECAPPSVSSPSLNGSSAHGPGRVVVYLDREIDVGRGPTASLFGTGSSSVHSGSARLGDSVQDCYDRPGPQFFDLTRQSCQLPGDSQVIQQFFTRTRFAFLRDAPSGLDKPHRFQAWLAAGTVGRSPSPTEEVVLTSDGSFRADSLAAGWGLVVSLRSSAEDAGQFVGCLFGSLAPFLPYLGGSQFPDAYDAEVAGLIWGAVAIAQLPAFGRVVVRADNISALRGVEGAAQMRASPLCLAARSLHASVGIAGSGQVRYEHVRGHSGEPANELADALAVLGATGCSSSAPFCLPISELFSEDALVARWLPHFAMSSKRALELPCLDSGVLSWPCTPGSPVHPPDFSMRPFLRAFPAADSLARCPAAGAWLDFRIATYNALSLLDGVKERSAGLHGLPGRPTLLQQSLVTAGVHVAGLQECRTTAGTMKCGRFTRFASGCDEHSCFGNELWVSADGPCDPTSVVLLHSAPTVLIAHARVGRHQIHFFVGHAPHRGHTLETRRAWWSAAAHLCHSYPRHVPWVFLLDANCRLGSRETHSVGSHQADDEDDAGVFLHDLLLGLDLCAPSTFASCMIGEGGTLYQKRSGALDRSDYVCIPRAWLPGDCRAWVDPSIAVGHACIDHLAAVVHCCLPSLGKQVSRDRAVRLDAQALADPDNRSRVEQIILGAPRPAWDTDVSEHAAEVVDYLYEAFSRNFPLPKRRLRASFFSEETTALHQAVAALRHAVRTRTHALRSTYLRCVLLAWRSPDADFGSFFCGSWLWNLRARLGHNCMLLRRFGRRLRSACKSDKATHLSSLSDEVAHAPYAEVHRAVHRVLRPRKYRKAACDPLPKLFKPDGTLCLSSDEVADTWREHFRILEGGVTVTAANLVRRCRSSQAAADRPDSLEATCMPSWLSLESAFRHSAPRKASGPDLIPPSICRAFSFSLTELFWPLLLKSLCYAAEPAGMKGGVLFHIDKGKPGAKAECASHRGILAQSCLSKVLHRSLRGLVVDHWSRNSMPLQVGGKPGCSATFGHLCSRSVLNFAKTRGLSAGLLFVDLQSAYYAVIRETVLGGGLSDRPLAAVADALGLDAEDLQILKYYVEEEPILHQQNASPLLVTMARELHQQTWFVLSEDPRAVLVETQRGTRPGGTLADVLFNVLFAKVLARRRDSACSSLSPSVPWCGVRTPFPDVTLPCDHTIQVTDIAYADDLCTPVVCQAACDLRGAVSCMTADTMDVLTPHALRPNLGPAKTAAVFAPVGKGSKQARCEAFVQLKGRVPIWPESKGLLWLDLVPRYRHLGSLISHDGKMGPEIRHRLALAASAFKEGKRKLFACKAIPLPKRALLFRSHVLSVLLSGAGTWPWLAKGEWQSFRGGVLGLYRQLLCLRASGDWHHTAAQIYSQVGLPSAEALLHAERLRLLGQLVRNAPDHVWALVAWNKPFQEGLQEACVWLYSLVGSTVSFGPIAANWSVWSCFIQSRPGHWKGLIRRAETADIERQHITAAFDRSIRETWAPLAPPCLSPMAEMDHACLLCGLAFSTQQQWGAHAQRKHGYRNSASKLAKGRQCQSCGTLYASQARLKTHLLASATCRHFLETLPQASLVPSGPGEGHVQAPPVRFASSLSVRSVGPDLCHDLLEALRHVESADDQEIFDLVSSFVAPLPVLRRTLRTWADSLLRGALLSSAEDVLLVLKPDLLCSQICGKVSEGLDLQTFDPCIVQPVHRPPSSPGSVFSVGACDAAWLQRWQLSYLPVVDTGLTELTSLPATCSGLCLTLPLPPCYAGSFLCPGSLPLRLLRQVSLWTSGFFASLPHALRIAARGVPVLLRVPVRSDQLLPVSAWLTRTATEFEDGLSFNCFTAEFIAKGTSF